MAMPKHAKRQIGTKASGEAEFFPDILPAESGGGGEPGKTSIITCHRWDGQP